MATYLVTKLILNFSFLCLETFFPNHFLSVDGKRAYCGPTGSLSYEIQATPILKIELPVLKEGPSNMVPKDLAGVVPLT